jgi:hypothetical protein
MIGRLIDSEQRRLWDAVQHHGSGLDQGFQSAVASGLGFADGYEEDVVGGQGDIGDLAAQDGLKVDRDLGPVIGAGHDAHDSGVLGGGSSFRAFGEGEDLEGAEGAMFAENVGSGLFDCADDVDRVGLRDRDHIVGLDEDVLRGIGGVHHALDVDGGDGELAGGIVSGAEERDGSPFQTAGDFDDVAGFRAETSGEGQDFEEIFLTLELMNAGSLNLAKDGDGLAAHFGEVDGDVGFDEHSLEAVGDGGFELLGGETAGLDVSHVGEIDVAPHIDGDGFVVNFLEIGDTDDDLVAGAERISIGRGRRRLEEQGQNGEEGERNGVHRDLTQQPSWLCGPQRFRRGARLRWP